MTKRTRRNHSGNVKAKVALAALKADRTLTEIADQYQGHPNQVTEWKRQRLERAADVPFAQPGFINEEDGAPLSTGFFFNIGQRLCFHSRIAFSSRWMARPVGR
jgi:transposase